MIGFHSIEYTELCLTARAAFLLQLCRSVGARALDLNLEPEPLFFLSCKTLLFRASVCFLPYKATACLCFWLVRAGIKSTGLAVYATSHQIDMAKLPGTRLGAFRAYFFGFFICASGFLFGYDTGIVGKSHRHPTSHHGQLNAF